MDVAAKLKKDISKNEGVETGTIVRFTSYDNVTDRRFTYAAVYAAQFWWLTGEVNYYGSKKLNHIDFMLILAREDVNDVEVAVAFDKVKG